MFQFGTKLKYPLHSFEVNLRKNKQSCKFNLHNHLTRLGPIDKQDKNNLGYKIVNNYFINYMLLYTNNKFRKLINSYL